VGARFRHSSATYDVPMSMHFGRSLRAQFGTDAQNNCLHGSDSRAKAERETQLIFGGVAAETIETDKN
jgi:nucleoside diphosphate kinase